MLGFFLTVFASLFSVVNPLGAMPMFVSLTTTWTVKERRVTALKASVFFVVILLVFFFGGSTLIDFFGISIPAMRIAGGFIIFMSGYALLTGKFQQSRSIDKKVKQEAMEKDDISLTPMAIPMLAGPGSISLLIGMFDEAHQWEEYLIIASTIVLLGIITAIILLVSPRLFHYIGVGGLNAISRIMGFIVMAIGVQFVINGITTVYPIG